MHFPLQQEDEWGCETAVTLQILYMLELCEPEHFPEIVQRIGRIPGQPDDANGGLRVLLEFGVYHHLISSFNEDLVAGPDGYEYLAGRMRDQGATEDYIAREVPRIHAHHQSRAIRTLQIVDQYRHLCAQSYRDAALLDVIRLRSCGLGVVEARMSYGAPGYAVPIVITPYDEPHFVRAYRPDRGKNRFVWNMHDFEKDMNPVLSFWSLEPAPPSLFEL